MASVNKVIIVGNLGRDPEMERYATEIRADTMQMLGSRQGGGGGQQGGGYGDEGYGDSGYDAPPQQQRRPAPAPMAAPAPRQAPAQRPAPAPMAPPPQRAASGFDDMDDDIPF
jgi:single-strand DNA-binding protein